MTRRLLHFGPRLRPRGPADRHPERAGPAAAGRAAGGAHVCAALAVRRAACAGPSIVQDTGRSTLARCSGPASISTSAETVRQALAFHRDLDCRADERGAGAARRSSARLVVSDIPAAGVRGGGARRRAVDRHLQLHLGLDLRRLHGGRARRGAAGGRVRACYARAAEGWRLPMHGGFESFPWCAICRSSPGSRRHGPRGRRGSGCGCRRTSARAGVVRRLPASPARRRRAAARLADAASRESSSPPTIRFQPSDGVALDRRAADVRQRPALRGPARRRSTSWSSKPGYGIISRLLGQRHAPALHVARTLPRVRRARRARCHAICGASSSISRTCSLAAGVGRGAPALSPRSRSASGQWRLTAAAWLSAKCNGV